MTENSDKTLSPRIAIGFFGITRSLKWTLPSIQKNWQEIAFRSVSVARARGIVAGRAKSSGMDAVKKYDSREASA